MTLAALMPLVLLVAVLVPGLAAWLLTQRIGVWPGIGVVVLVVAAAVFRSQAPIPHAEAAMGRSIEMFIFWIPVVISSLTGVGIGFAIRRRRGARH